MCITSTHPRRTEMSLHTPHTLSPCLRCSRAVFLVHLNRRVCGLFRHSANSRIPALQDNNIHQFKLPRSQRRNAQKLRSPFGWKTHRVSPATFVPVSQPATPPPTKRARRDGSGRPFCGQRASARASAKPVRGEMFRRPDVSRCDPIAVRCA